MAIPAIHCSMPYPCLQLRIQPGLFLIALWLWFLQIVKYLSFLVFKSKIIHLKPTSFRVLQDYTGPFFSTSNGVFKDSKVILSACLSNISELRVRREVWPDYLFVLMDAKTLRHDHSGQQLKLFVACLEPTPGIKFRHYIDITGGNRILLRLMLVKRPSILSIIFESLSIFTLHFGLRNNSIKGA